ncbi:MAG: DUF4430 domain-containing protein [Oscillospiraceae bacterium]
MNSKTKKILIVAGAALVVLLAVFIAMYVFGRPATTAGDKHITVSVTHNDKSVKVFEIDTDAEFLGSALVDEKLVSGEQGEFGLWVKTVDGYTADDAKQEWWSFMLNGEFLNTGIDQTPIKDSDKVDIILTVGF